MIWIAPSEKDTDTASPDYDAFGRIYEYFLAPWERVAAPAFGGPVQVSPTGRGEFAMSEGQGGQVKSELRRPKSELPSIRHSAFDIRHLHRLSIHGVEKTDETGRLCRLNLAVHGLEGEIKHGGQVNIQADHCRADATGDMVEAGRDVGVERPELVKRGLAVLC